MILTTFDTMGENRRPRTFHLYNINSFWHRDAIWLQSLKSKSSYDFRPSNIDILKVRLFKRPYAGFQCLWITVDLSSVISLVISEGTITGRFEDTN